MLSSNSSKKVKPILMKFRLDMRIGYFSIFYFYAGKPVGSSLFDKKETFSVYGFVFYYSRIRLTKLAQYWIFRFWFTFNSSLVIGPDYGVLDTIFINSPVPWKNSN